MKSTDTIPVKLTPREAVLNRNAAELLGRDAIKRLNDHGNMLAKRGVDLASDPSPYPASENLAGLQMGTADARRDDRGDLLKDAENTFYGGGTVPLPTPTPTPRRGYQYGTDDVEDSYAPYGSGASTNRTVKSFVSRYGLPNSRGNVTTPTPSGGTATVGQSNDYGFDRSTVVDPGAPLSRNPVSTSQYIGRGGKTIGPQYDPITGTVNPFPSGAVGIQGSPKPLPSFASSKPLSHTEMAADIARRNLASVGSQPIGAPQPNTPPPITGTDVMSASQATGAGGNYGLNSFLTEKAYLSPQNQQALADQRQNAISRIQPDTFKDQGIDTSQSMQNVDLNFLANLQKEKDQQSGYGSAYQ